MAVNVCSKSEVDVGLNLKADRIDTYPKAEITVALGILQAGIDNRVLVDAVGINGKSKLKATSNDILKIQRVAGSLVYDALELSFDMFDKTSIFKSNNVQFRIVKFKSYCFKRIYKSRNKREWYDLCECFKS